MKIHIKELRLLALVALVAFAVCWATNHFKYFPHLKENKGPHQWLHSQLNITFEQDKKLTDIEERFQKRKLTLEATIKGANSELAKVIMKDKRNSEQVKAAVNKIHHAQGELQKVTLEHLFEMQTVLTPEQSEKLNRMAADALIHNP